jgi:hypothetical protein
MTGLDPLRNALDDALHSWAAPARPLLPLAVRCAAELDDSGTLCEHLAGSCPEHPVCGAEEPLTQSARCLRRDCDGVHAEDGEGPWTEALERPTLAETRTGTDWCPSCEHEVGTDRVSTAGGDHCASCGRRLVQVPECPPAVSTIQTHQPERHDHR